MFTNAKIVGSNVSPDAYHAQPDGVSRGHRNFVMGRSSLMAFYACPERWLAGGHEETDTSATEWGKWLDAYLLGKRNEFAITPATYPAKGKLKGADEQKPWNRNADYCRAWEEQREGRLIVKHDEWGRIKTAGDRLLADPIIRELILASLKQVMVVAEWRDDETEIVVPVKALIDLAPDSRHREFGNWLADLKCVESAHPGGWPRKAFTYHWHVQAAFYLDISCAATGEDRNTFVNIVQESHAPFQPGHEMYSVEFVQLGRETYQSALRSYCRCLATGVWPNYSGMQDERDKIGAWSLAQPEPWMIAKQLV